MFNHPVNQVRNQRGEAGPNSLWLWGGCHIANPPVIEKIRDVVFCNEPFVQDVSIVCDIPCKPLPQKIDERILRYHDPLLIFTDQLAAIRNKDVFGWFDILQRFDQDFLSPLFEMLSSRKLDTLTVYSNSVSITLSAGDLKRWWRRNKPFSTSVQQLRQHYGH